MKSNIIKSARSAGKKNIKIARKDTAKSAQKSVKATKTVIKTSQQTAQQTAQTAKTTAKVTAAGVKSAAKATTGAVKTAFTAAKTLVAAIMAGGWGAVAVIVMICMIGLICGSVFGVFFSGEDSGTGMSMQTAVQEINAEYDAKVEDEKSAASYDNVEISGGRAVWKEVLAVYAVKTNTDKDNPQEVVTMDESKKQTLSDIFWEMNSISSHCKSHSETEVTETDDGNGNIVQQKTTVTKRTLYITVSHMTANEMADRYGFDEEQRRYIAHCVSFLLSFGKVRLSFSMLHHETECRESYIQHCPKARRQGNHIILRLFCCFLYCCSCIISHKNERFRPDYITPYRNCCAFSEGKQGIV